MSRKAFEEWASEAGYGKGETDDDFDYPLGRALRKAWQAATNAALQRAAHVCDAAEIFAWEQWKCTGHPHTEGVSDGAASLARDIRALKDESWLQLAH